MEESVSHERKIEPLKPNMKTLTNLEVLEVTPDTVALGKLDGEFILLSYNRSGESYVVNKWGHRRTDFPALNQFVEAMNKTEITHTELLCELYAEENGKPTNLPRYLHLIKGKNKDLTKIHIGIWDLIKIDGYTPKEAFAWKLGEVKRWVEGCTHVKVAPYIQPKTIQDLKDFWRICVEQRGYEGLVIRKGEQIYKIKPCLDVDAVIIGLNKKSSNGRNLDIFQRKEITSLKLALMQEDGTFIDLCDCASGITLELRTALWKLMEHKVGEDANTVYVKPLVVCAIQYTDTYLKEKRVLKFDGEKYSEVETKPFVSLKHPRLIGFRPDKTVNPQDLRTAQIPQGQPLQFSLYHGDCRTILPTIRSESIDLIVTSPPYWKLYEFSGVEGEIGTKGTPDEYVSDLLSVFKECARILAPNGLMMLNMDNGRREDGVFTVSAWDWIKPLRELGFRLTQTIIWTDNTRRPLRHPRLLDHHYEPIFVLAKGKNYTWNWQESKNKGDVWNIQHYKGYVQEKGDQWDRMGIATFPVALVEELMKLGSKGGDRTLDPFAGSGTVMDTAQRLGRNNVSVEVSPDYCQTIISRCFDKNPLHKYTFEAKQQKHKTRNE